MNRAEAVQGIKIKMGKHYCGNLDNSRPMRQRTEYLDLAKGIAVLWNLCLISFWFWFLWNVENEYSNMQPFKHLKWLGRNVTILYAMQWLIIGNIGTNVYKTQELDELID